MRDQDPRASGADHAVASSDRGTQLLSDRPLTNDRNDSLGFAAYADALAGIIGDSETDTPLTIAISAEWGAGKTSLARMIEHKLLDKEVFPNRQNITCWFNAWMHDDAPKLGAAFAAKVARDINRSRPIWRRLISPLPSDFYSPEERWRRRIVMGLASFFTVALAALIPNIRVLLRDEFSSSTVTAPINSALSAKWASAAVLAVALVAASRVMFGIAQAAARFVNDPQTEASRGSMQLVHDQLASLIRQAISRRASLFRHRFYRQSRLVIFVDDLERCTPPRALDVCEVANQLLSVEGVVTILVADMQVIATSAAVKYFSKESSDRSDGIGGRSTQLSPLRYGRAYLEKMIQIEFSLPASTPEVLQEMLSAVGGGCPREEGRQQNASGTEAGLIQAPLGASIKPVHDNDKIPQHAESQERSEHGRAGQPVNVTPDFLEEVRRLKDVAEAWNLAIGLTFFFGWIPVLVPLLLIDSSRWWLMFPADIFLTAALLAPSLRVDSKLEHMTGRKAKEAGEYIREISEQASSIEEVRDVVQGSSAARNAPAEFVKEVMRLKNVTEAWNLATGLTILFGWIPMLVVVLFVDASRWWIIFPADILLTLVVMMPSMRADSKLEHMTGRRVKEVDEYIKEISEQASSIEELREVVQGSSAARNASTEFVDQRIQRFLVDESRLRERAELVVRHHVPALPRGAKRAINQLRVALAVAVRRGMFDSSSPLQPEQLGKWIVLVERWPELAERLALDPRLIGDLESLSVTNMSRRVLHLAPELDNVGDLCNLLQGEPRLQPVLARLVRFEPWAPTGKTSLPQIETVGDSADSVARYQAGGVAPIVH